MSFRKAVRWALTGTGILAALLGALYLLRWPLFEGRVRAEIARLAGEHLKADVSIGRLHGNLLESIEAEGIQIAPRPGSPLDGRSGAASVRVRYGFLGGGPLEIDAAGLEVRFPPKPGPPPPIHQTVREAFPALRAIRFDGKVRARDSRVVLPDGRELEVAEATLEGADWTVRLRSAGFGEVRVAGRGGQGGALAVDAQASEGPVPSAKAALGPLEGASQTLRIEGRLSGHALLWEGKVVTDAEGVAVRAEGRLAVPQGRAETALDLVLGRGRLDVDGTVEIREPVRADVELKGVAEGPLQGPIDAWTFSAVTAKTRNAVYKTLKIDFAEASCAKGTLARLPVRAGFSAGKDHAEGEGIARWTGSLALELTGRAEAEDLAPYLLLLPEPPPLKAAKARAEGTLTIAEQRAAFDGSVETGPGSFDGRSWDSMRLAGTYAPGRIDAREILARGTLLAPVVTGKGTLEGDRVDAQLEGGPDRVAVKGRATSTGDFDGEFSVEGPCLWLRALEVELPEWARPLRLAGRATRAGATTRGTLTVLAGKDLSASTEVVAREKDGVWMIEFAPGTIELPGKRPLEHDRFSVEAKAGRIAVPDVKLVLKEPPFTARLSASVEWDARETRVALDAREIEAWGIRLEALRARADADRSRNSATVELRWGREGGPFFEATGRLGRENDLSVRAVVPDLRDPLVRKLLGDPPVEGSASLDVHVYGTIDRPDASGTVELRGITAGGWKPVRLVAAVRTEDRTALRLWAEEATPYGKLAFDGRVTLPWIDPKPRVDLTATLETTDFSPLLERIEPEARPWVPPGKLNATATLRGPVATPVWWVEGKFEGARFKPPEPLGTATGLRASVRFDETGLRVESVEGALGGGPFRGQGLWEAWKKERPFALHVTGDDALVIEDELARIRIKPDVTLRYSTARGLRLEGSVDVPFALYHREFGASTLGGEEKKKDPGLAVAPRLRLIPLPGGGFRIPGIAGLEGLALDLEFRTTGEFRLENSVVGALLGVEGRLRGTGTVPALSGKIRSRPHNGEVRLGSGVFLRMESAEIVMPAEPGKEATVRFEGRVGSGREAITVVVAGPPDHPTLSLLSDPPKPQKELMGFLVSKASLGTLTSQLNSAYSDDWPLAERKEGFLERLNPVVIPGEAPGQRRNPWELPPVGTGRGTVVRTEYLWSRHFSIIAETDHEADVTGDLKFRIRF